MNRKNMVRSLFDNDLLVIYDVGVVAKARLDYETGIISFHFRNDQIVQVDITNCIFPDTIYLQQFGITLTEDGHYFLIQSWESGLFCFELLTGQKIWHCKRKKAYNLAVCGNTVICRFFDQCVDLFDVSSGEILSHYPLGSGTVFLELTSDLYLVGPKRNSYHIINNTLKDVTRIPYSSMNPSGFDTFILNEASLIENGIFISGFEYDYNDVWNGRENNTENVLVKRKFARNVYFNSITKCKLQS